MKITEKQDGDVTILVLSGEMINVKLDIHPAVKQLIEEGKKKVVVDVGKVKWFASTALGSLMASYSSLKAADGDMKIARASKKIYSLFYQMKLQEVFDSYDTIEEAVAAFKE